MPTPLVFPQAPRLTRLRWSEKEATSPSPTPKWGLGSGRRLRLALAVGCCALLGLVVGRWFAVRSSSPPLAVARAQRGHVVERVQTVSLGRVSAKRELTLRAEAATRIASVVHRVGEWVDAGDTIVSLDPTPMAGELRAAEQLLASARAAAREAALRAELARSREKRQQRLSGVSITTADQEALHFERKIAEQSALAAASRAGEQRERVRSLAGNLDRADLRAPFSGVVLQVSVEEGQAVLPGAALVTIADVSTLHVSAELDQADAERVKLHAPVELSFEGSSDPPWRSSISAIDPSVSDNERGRRVVGIEVALPQGISTLVGRGAQVDVIVAENHDALLVPSTTLLGTGPRREVWVASDQQARPRIVEIGVVGWDAVEVRSGLEPGELVVSNPAAAKAAAGRPLLFAEATDAFSARKNDGADPR
jgi:RND family efflux transporter MFP subunit